MMNSLDTALNVPKKKTGVRFFTVVLLFFLMVALFFNFNFKTVEVKGESMLPTLKQNQKVLLTKAFWLVGELKKNDIIVLKEESKEGYFIKRIMGLPGDKIQWTFAPLGWELAKGQYVVPEGRVYVVGDNLNHSDDSRKFGAFAEDQILGKVITWR